MIKLVIFDLDGTLIDSMDLVVETFRITAEALGIPIDLSKVRKSIGLPGRQILARAVLKPISEKETDEFLRRRSELHNRLIAKIRLFPDTISTLEKLREKGYLIAIASSNKRKRLERILSVKNLDQYVSVTVSYEDVDKPKPHPDMVLKAVELAGVKTQEAIMVGDTVYDVEAAKRAGVISVLIAREHKQSFKEDFRVSSLEDILDILEKLDC